MQVTRLQFIERWKVVYEQKYLRKLLSHASSVSREPHKRLSDKTDMQMSMESLCTITVSTLCFRGLVAKTKLLPVSRSTMWRIMPPNTVPYVDGCSWQPLNQSSCHVCNRQKIAQQQVSSMLPKNVSGTNAKKSSESAFLRAIATPSFPCIRK